MTSNGLDGFLGCLPFLSDAESRSVSAENPTGAKGAGAAAVPDAANAASRMGVGWKVRPFIALEPGTEHVIADIEGPGSITHIWLTIQPRAFRDVVIRMFWDNEVTPSVECPLGDFFCNGHGRRCDVNSMMVAVCPDGGLNCYWPMPFRQRARVTVENQSEQAFPHFYYQIDYAKQPVGERAAYFHAQWRRTPATDRAHPEHVILEGVQGQGHYVGTYCAWAQLSNGWWGEGELKWFIDGDDLPTICGTGTEDYFGGAWSFGDRAYSTPFLGYPLRHCVPGEVPAHGLYRWHVLDPIRFKRDLKVTVQALGWWPDRKYQPLADDISTVAYWYQTEPHAEFPLFPTPSERRPR